jgi:TonB family protein
MTSLRLEIGLSLGLHAVVITALLLVGGMASTKRFKPGEIIKVSLTAGPAEKIAPAITPAKPVAPTITPPTPIPTKGAKAIANGKKKPEPTKKKSGVRKGEEARFEAERANNEIVSDATASGSPFAGATVDNLSFDYPYWFVQAFTKIQSNWINTVETDGEIVCVVYFQVIKSGRLMDARVETESGIEAFDQGCLGAIYKSAPFPPLPSDFADEVIGITLPFKYSPR